MQESLPMNDGGDQDIILIEAINNPITAGD
jgi:hypothetical protein